MAPRWSEKPARSLARRCASSPTPNSAIRHSGARALRANPESGGRARVWIPDSGALPAPRNDGKLFRSLLDRRDLRQDDLHLGATARLGIQVQPAAQPVGDDAVDDVQ